MLTTLALMLAAPLPQEQASDSAADCSYDLEEMLALDLDGFDQDFDGGWRALSARGCDAEAAELIRDWRYFKRSNSPVLYWHEGQMRAFAGQTEAALELMQLRYKSPALDAGFGFNHYLDGTIAFLVGDRDMLDAAIAALETMPLDEGLDSPPNLGVLHAFRRCWGRSYKQAYTDPACFDPPAGDAAAS